MVSDSIERDVLIEAPVEVVWSVVTEPDKIRLWLSDAAAIDLAPGGDGELTWDSGLRVPIVVETVDPPRTFAFRWVYPEGATPDERNSMRVEFTLEPEGDQTRLRVVESGLSSVEWDDARKDGYFAEHGEGWDKHFARLRDHFAATRAR